jgi:hypothetical protein
MNATLLWFVKSWCAFRCLLGQRGARRAKDRNPSSLVVVSTFQEVDAQAGSGGEHPGQLRVAEPGTDGPGRGGDQSEHVLLHLGGGADRGATRGQRHPQRLPFLTAGREPSRVRASAAMGVDADDDIDHLR